MACIFFSPTTTIYLSHTYPVETHGNVEYLVGTTTVKKGEDICIGRLRTNITKLYEKKEKMFELLVKTHRS